MWVVKLGGSLLGTPELARWLETLIRVSDGKIVVVPGGGILADAVRDAQKLSSVSDEVAHELALIAMDQFGLLLAGMNPGLVTASSELEMAERGWQHRAIVWLPSKMVMADESVPKNWQVTSDSISAWLANKISADQLVLVKSKSLKSYANMASVSTQTLIQDELIDAGFADFYSEAQYGACVVNKEDFNLFKHGLDEPKLHAHGILIKRS
jgi:aspartokinase-like uncharacterized kinase